MVASGLGSRRRRRRRAAAGDAVGGKRFYVIVFQTSIRRSSRPLHRIRGPPPPEAPLQGEESASRQPNWPRTSKLERTPRSSKWAASQASAARRPRSFRPVRKLHSVLNFEERDRSCSSGPRRWRGCGSGGTAPWPPRSAGPPRSALDEGDGAKLGAQRGVHGDLVEPVDDLAGGPRRLAAMERVQRHQQDVAGRAFALDQRPERADCPDSRRPSSAGRRSPPPGTDCGRAAEAITIVGVSSARTNTFSFASRTSVAETNSDRARPSGRREIDHLLQHVVQRVEVERVEVVGRWPRASKARRRR